MARMIWIAVAYNLYYSVAYPIYNTANATMVPVSTRNGQQRSMLASLSNIAGLGVMGTGSMVFPILASNILKNYRSRWLMIMIFVALITALTIILQYKFTRERVTEEDLLADPSQKENAVKTATMKEQLKAVTSEKWWWIIIIFYMLFQWAGAIKNGAMTQFCEWVVGLDVVSGDWGIAQTILSIAGAVPMAVAVVVVMPLAGKIGKAKTTFIFLVIGFLGGLIAGLFPENLLMVGLGVGIKCLGSSPACYLILAMLADVIDHIEYKTGMRTDGLTMSIYSSLMVAATPIGSAILNALLTAFGFDQTLVFGEGVQSASARMALSVSYIWIETVCYGICALLILGFTVEKNLKKEQEEIKIRKGLE